MANIHCGIFVGGLGSRMGGVAKGLLRTENGGPQLIERLVAQLQLAAPDASIVLLGQRPEYANLGLPLLADAVVGIGPMGGLKALLLDAQRAQARNVLALACDLPYVTAAFLRRLAQEHPAADALAPKPDGRWQPLCARYAVEPALQKLEMLLGNGEHALFRLLEVLDCRALELSPDEQRELDDWDEPRDMQRRNSQR